MAGQRHIQQLVASWPFKSRPLFSLQVGLQCLVISGGHAVHVHVVGLVCTLHGADWASYLLQGYLVYDYSLSGLLLQAGLQPGPLMQICHLGFLYLQQVQLCAQLWCTWAQAWCLHELLQPWQLLMHALHC